MLQKVNVFNLSKLHDENGKKLPIDIPNSIATGLELMCSESFRAIWKGGAVFDEDAHLGVDMLRLSAGEAFPLHTHPGHHLLMCLRGRGTVSYEGVTHNIVPGDIYLMDGGVEHAVGAIDDHFILAFGAPHVHLEDPARMTVVEPETLGQALKRMVDADSQAVPTEG